MQTERTSPPGQAVSGASGRGGVQQRPFGLSPCSPRSTRPSPPRHLRTRGGRGPAHLRRVHGRHLVTTDRQATYDDGVTTATGKRMWSPTTISGLLTNPTYMGKAA